MAKNLLIVIGPQGAGNHLWSKVFSLHPEVFGWKSLLNNYWEPHRFSEPFAKHWKNPALLQQFDWSQSEYFFTSISCPLGIIDSDVNPIWNPNVELFIESAQQCGINVQVAVIGRDQTILKHQQTRIRSAPTLPIFLEQLQNLSQEPVFLSYELLYLYGRDYLKSLKLNIPIDYDNSRLVQILEDDANSKYIHSIDYNQLDLGNKTGITFALKPA